MEEFDLQAYLKEIWELAEKGDEKGAEQVTERAKSAMNTYLASKPNMSKEKLSAIFDQIESGVSDLKKYLEKELINPDKNQI